jgi:demethoxyubiquinone hydroxylase (CLK1/Coq7/Cat5 family)
METEYKVQDKCAKNLAAHLKRVADEDQEFREKFNQLWDETFHKNGEVKKSKPMAEEV